MSRLAWFDCVAMLEERVVFAVRVLLCVCFAKRIVCAVSVCCRVKLVVGLMDCGQINGSERLNREVHKTLWAHMGGVHRQM